MKTVFSSLVIAFSMYSKIPMPRVEWTEENRKYAICFFPLVGLVTGGRKMRQEEENRGRKRRKP